MNIGERRINKVIPENELIQVASYLFIYAYKLKKFNMDINDDVAVSSMKSQHILLCTLGLYLRKVNDWIEDPGGVLYLINGNF